MNLSYHIMEPTAEWSDLPLEIQTLILENLRTTKLMNYRTVCSDWKTIIESIVRRRTGITFPQISEFNIKDAFIVSEKFGQNFLKNSHFEDQLYLKDNLTKLYIAFSLPFWNRAPEWKADWAVERPPVGTRGDIPLHFLKKENLQSMLDLTCVANDCRRGNRLYQEIHLTKLGISNKIMDCLKPKIIVEEWVGSRLVSGCFINIKVEVFDRTYKLLAQKKIELLIPAGTSQWRKVSFCVKDYGPGARIIRFSHSGRDFQYLAGFYSSKFALPFVTLSLNKSH